MAVKEIKWSDEADLMFEKIVNYLQENWPEQVVKNFVQTTDRILDNIAHNPKMYRRTSRPHTHEVVITSHTLLVYEVSPERVNLLTFWDNRQDPRQKPYNG